MELSGQRAEVGARDTVSASDGLDREYLNATPTLAYHAALGTNSELTVL